MAIGAAVVVALAWSAISGALTTIMAILRVALQVVIIGGVAMGAAGVIVLAAYLYRRRNATWRPARAGEARIVASHHARAHGHAHATAQRYHAEGVMGPVLVAAAAETAAERRDPHEHLPRLHVVADEAPAVLGHGHSHVPAMLGEPEAARRGGLGVFRRVSARSAARDA